MALADLLKEMLKKYVHDASKHVYYIVTGNETIYLPVVFQEIRKAMTEHGLLFNSTMRDFTHWLKQLHF